jgi:hypothetical protein
MSRGFMLADSVSPATSEQAHIFEPPTCARLGRK